MRQAMSQSVQPSQSSSALLHTSAPGLTPPSHTLAPPMLQAVVPVRKQAPLSPLSHAAPRAKPLSVTPSQSLSTPSQSSGTGVTAPTQRIAVTPPTVVHWLPPSLHRPAHTPVPTLQP